MSFAVSDRWLLAADSGGARPISELTCTLPGGEPVALSMDGCVVTKNLDQGPRFTASVTVQRAVGQHTLDMVLTPGAIFTIGAGWDFGAGQTETIPMGVFELGQQPKAARSGSIPLVLVDRWKRLEECRFITPVTAALGVSRVSVVSAQVSAAIPGIDISTQVIGGTVGAAATWDTDRTALINDLSRDGQFWAGFGPDGTFEMLPLPTLGIPATTYTDGERAKILDLSTEQTFARLYNGVVVKPVDGQAWAAVAVWIDDPDSPRDPSKIGHRPYFATALTAANQSAARSVGNALLSRVIGVSRRVEVSTWGEAHREAGDTFATAQAGTWFDGADSGEWLAETVAYDCITTQTTITGRSVDTPLTEET